MKNTFLISLIVLAAAVFAAKPVEAQVWCSTQYGGCPPSSQSVTINKMVKIPKTNNWAENLLFNDPRYNDKDMVEFLIVVTNKSGAPLENVMVYDKIPQLPQYLEPVKGPDNSSYDSTTRTITIKAGNFGPFEEKKYVLTMQVVLPPNSGVVCQIENRVRAESGSVSAEDMATLCAQGPNLKAPVTQVPSTGPESAVATIVGSAVALYAGLKLRKRIA